MKCSGDFDILHEIVRYTTRTSSCFFVFWCGITNYFVKYLGLTATLTEWWCAVVGQNWCGGVRWDSEILHEIVCYTTRISYVGLSWCGSERSRWGRWCGGFWTIPSCSASASMTGGCWSTTPGTTAPRPSRGRRSAPHLFNTFFASEVSFLLYTLSFIQYIISQWSCSASRSLWEMPDSIPELLPQKSGELEPMDQCETPLRLFLQRNTERRTNLFLLIKKI